MADTRCGFVGVVGRPNVGKSTLINRLLGQKLLITSRRPQTTRHRILGIKTAADAQCIFVDTPGLHRHASKAINRYMNQAATSVLDAVDVRVMVVEALRWSEEDTDVAQAASSGAVPTVLAVNKVDQVREKSELLPFLEQSFARGRFRELVPLSARTGENLAEFERIVRDLLPAGPFLFDPDQITDRSERFVAAEFIREQLMRILAEEVPYGAAVSIERLIDDADLLRIDAVIWMERESQKRIVIGKGAARLKHIGRGARLEIERFFGKRVFLHIWVKVKEDWSDNEGILKRFGYTE